MDGWMDICACVYVCIWIQYIQHIYSDVHLLVSYLFLRMIQSEMMNEVITSTIDSKTELLNTICFAKAFNKR